MSPADRTFGELEDAILAVRYSICIAERMHHEAFSSVTRAGDKHQFEVDRLLSDASTWAIEQADVHAKHLTEAFQAYCECRRGA